MIKAVLFDLDGVVIDSEPLYATAEKKLFHEYGISIPEDDWKLFRGSTEGEFYQLAIDRYHIREDKEILMDTGRKLVRQQFNDKLSFMPGFQSLMNRIISFGLKTGLVTSSPGPMFDLVNHLLQVEQYFQEIIYGGMTRYSKPHPEPYLHMMDLLKVVPDECVILEDSVHGLNAAVASGAHVIALTGSVNPEDMPQYDVLVTHLDQISIDMLSNIQTACTCGKSQEWMCTDLCYTNDKT